MWKAHWGLTRNPFAETESPYVSLPSHDEAVARLVFAVENAHRRAIIAGQGGLGKSAVLRKSLRELASSLRRLIVISCPREGRLLFALVAQRLGQRAGREPTRVGAWRALERAIRVASLQGEQVVVIVENCDQQVDETVRQELEMLSQIGSMTGAGLTIVQLERTDAESGLAIGSSFAAPIGLQRLTRSETEHYLSTKIHWAGSAERLFTPRAITRIQALSLGVPRGVEQLASTCLMTGAVRGLEVITPELVDAAALQSWPGFIATSA